MVQNVPVRTSNVDSGVANLCCCVRAKAGNFAGGGTAWETVHRGDGIDIVSLEKILSEMKERGFAADNIVFGSGGALLQKLHRDTNKCAFKCSYAVVKGQGVDVVKDPITDPGKKSKKGRLMLDREKSGKWVTVTEGRGDPKLDHLREVFRDGKLLIERSLKGIRERSNLDTLQLPEPPAAA